MRKRRLLLGLMAAGTFVPRTLFAQAARLPLVSVLFVGEPGEDERAAKPFFDAMAKSGWIEGKTINYERHSGKGWAKGWDHRGEPRDAGPYTRFENSAERYVYEFRDASCRYKYEYGYRSGRAKVDQRGDCSGIAFPQRVVVQGREPLPRAIPPEPQAQQIECNREVIGTVLGGAVGAVVGSKIGKGDERVVTTCLLYTSDAADE